LRKGFGVGFERDAAGAFYAVADWSELDKCGIRRRTLISEIVQAYGLEATVTTMSAKGFVVADQRSEADGSLRIVMRRVS